MTCHSPPFEAVGSVGTERWSGDREAGGLVRLDVAVEHVRARRGDGRRGRQRDGLEVDEQRHQRAPVGRRNGRPTGRSELIAARASNTPAAPVPRSIDSRESWSPAKATYPAYGTACQARRAAW